MFTRLGLWMNHYTILFFLQKTKTFSLALPTSNFTQELKPPDISYDQIYLQRSTQNFEIRRRVPRVKKQTDEIQKDHTHLFLSTCRSAHEMFTLMSLHQFLSLSLSLHLQHGLDLDQTRMVFRIECFVNLKMCACNRKYAKR